MKRKKPYFGWGLPDNASNFFDPSYDDEYKKKHPVLYVFVVLAICVLVCIPFAVFCLIATTVEPHIDTLPEFILFLLGMVASVSAGFGLCNFFLLLHNEYLGHWVTIITLGGGVVLCAVCVILLAVF